MAAHYNIPDAANRRRLIRGSPWFEPIRVIGKHWELTEPVAIWRPGDPPPDFGAVSYRLIRRWKETVTMPLLAYRATRIARGLYGGTAGKLGCSAAHHLGVAALFLALRSSGLHEDWQVEDARFWPQRAKRPDAFRGETYLDFGGCYGPGRIRELYRMAKNKQVSIEIW